METTIKNFSKPDNRMDLPKVSIDSCQLCSAKIARMTVQPGWKWSTCIKPVVQTEWCMATHIGCLTHGQLHVLMKNGQEYDIKAGDCYEIQPEHDAWIVGDKETIAFEFQPQIVDSLETANSKRKED